MIVFFVAESIKKNNKKTEYTGSKITYVVR